MLIYIFTTILGIALCYFTGTLACYRQPKGLAKWIPIIPLFIVSIIRYDVGRDYLPIYDTMFHWIEVEGWAGGHDTEPGFLALNAVVGWVSDTSYPVFFIMAVAFFFFMWKFILDESDNIPISLALLLLFDLFTQSMNLVRQMAALAFCCYATRYLGEKNARSIIKYVICVLIASLFHATSLLFLVFIIFTFHYVNERAVAIMAILAVVIALFGRQIIEPFINAISGGRYANYFDGRFDKGFYWSIVVEWIIIGMVMLYAGRALRAYRTDAGLFQSILAVGAFLAFISNVIPNSERISLMFMPFLMILAPALLNVYQKPKNWLLFLAVVAPPTIKWVYDMTWGGDTSGTFEYQTIFGLLFS